MENGTQPRTDASSVAPTLSLERLRSTLGRTWLIAVFGTAYVISQATLLVLVHPLGAEFLKLQCCGFSAQAYLRVFGQWEASGVMAAYRAHLLLDDAHWLWYVGLFTALLCRLFEDLRVPGRFNGVLVLPLASGLLDWFENRLQHVFLSSPDFATLVDPLPLISSLASDAKWILVLAYVPLTGVLIAKTLFSRRGA